MLIIVFVWIVGFFVSIALYLNNIDKIISNVYGNRKGFIKVLDGLERRGFNPEVTLTLLVIALSLFWFIVWPIVFIYKCIKGYYK